MTSFSCNASKLGTVVDNVRSCACVTAVLPLVIHHINFFCGCTHQHAGKKSTSGSSAEPGTGVSSQGPKPTHTKFGSVFARIKCFVPVRKEHHIVSDRCALPDMATDLTAL